MKILVLSDLHFEFQKDYGKAFLDSINADPDVCIVAGDLTDFSGLKAAIDKLVKRFKEVIYVYGNHECYGGSISKVKKTLNDIKFKNFHFLDNSCVTINGQRFIGACLWFKNDPNNVHFERGMSDFKRIKHFHSQVYLENDNSFKYLNKTVESNDIVITHHLPTEKSIGEAFRGSSLNRFFVCQMDPLIFSAKPKIWIHGHTHDSFDYKLGDTRIICNPFGYARYEENANFKQDLEIEV